MSVTTSLCPALRSELDEEAEMAGWDHPSLAPYALFGSAVLLLHGLREHIADVDVFVDHMIWERLAGRLMWSLRLPDPQHPPYLERPCDGRRVHAFYAWRRDESDMGVNALEARAVAETVGGWSCAPLRVVRLHKAVAVQKYGIEGRWAKHPADIAAIDRHLAEAKS